MTKVEEGKIVRFLRAMGCLRICMQKVLKFN